MRRQVTSMLLLDTSNRSNQALMLQQGMADISLLSNKQPCRRLHVLEPLRQRGLPHQLYGT